MEETQYAYHWLTLRNVLIVSQVAITVVLLSVALLFTKSLARVQSIHAGFDLQQTAWAAVNVLSDRYSKAQSFLFALRSMDAAAAVPGVQSAALAQVVPFNNFMRVGTPVQTGKETVNAEYFQNGVSASYFDTMGIPMLAGRGFTAADAKGTPRVVILNDAFARRLFGTRPAVGERIWFGTKKEGPGVQIAGVVGNSKHLTMGETQAYAVYEHLLQTQPGMREINVLVRAAGDADTVVAGVAKTLRSLDETAAVEVGALRAKLAFAYLPSQIGAVLVGTLGALGLSLALIGIYGAMSFAVSRRTAEMGIRMALGASSTQIFRAVLSAPLGALCAGMVIGIGLGMAVASQLALFFAEGVGPADPITFGAVVLICLAVGAVAAAIPAKRILAVDPVSTLRVQ
jgi:predicted permease